MPRCLRRAAQLAAVLALLGAASAAHANERHFTYVYETAVLPPGASEIEVWTTPRIGHHEHFVRFDQRLEFEVGITDRLMTAFYLNFSNTTAEVTPGVRKTDFEFGGVSSEWKYKITDPVADAIGIGVYGEVTGSTDELEIEAKLLLDKRIGNVLIAANLIAEQELEFTVEETESEQELDLVLGATYFIRPGITLGLELRNHNAIEEGEFEHSTLSAGPVFGFAADSWWVALTILPQLPALFNEGEGLRALDEHEKVEARLLFSLHL